jgi:hypothetical protein
MTPRERARRIREVALLRQLQQRRAVAYAATCVAAHREAEERERRQRDVVSDFSAGWSRALSAHAVDPAHVGAWAAMTRQATVEAAERTRLATVSGDIATEAVKAFVTAHTVAEHTACDARDADAMARRHHEEKRDAAWVELRLARRSHA